MDAKKENQIRALARNGKITLPRKKYIESHVFHCLACDKLAAGYTRHPGGIFLPTCDDCSGRKIRRAYNRLSATDVMNITVREGKVDFLRSDNDRHSEFWNELLAKRGDT